MARKVEVIKLLIHFIRVLKYLRKHLYTDTLLAFCLSGKQLR